MIGLIFIRTVIIVELSGGKGNPLPDIKKPPFRQYTVRPEWGFCMYYSLCRMIRVMMPTVTPRSISRRATAGAMVEAINFFWVKRFLILHRKNIPKMSITLLSIGTCLKVLEKTFL